MTDKPIPSPTLQELPELRRRTEQISKTLREQIAGHLETLRPLVSPERLLGKYAGGKSEARGAEHALAELQKAYKPFSAKPFDLPEKLDSHWLTLVGSAIELHPWEYVHSVNGKSIALTSPVKWVLSYRGNYSSVDARRVLGGADAGHPEHLRQFVINALVMKQAIAGNPGLVQLFHDLRYEMETETNPDLKNVPLVTVKSFLKSFRPSDELIEAATSFSGIPAFIELLDLKAAAAPPDPFRDRIQSLLE